MTKKEFEKIVKSLVLKDGAKVVDLNTTYEKKGVFKDTYISTVIAIRGHVAHRYSAWSDENNEVFITYSKCLGA